MITTFILYLIFFILNGLMLILPDGFALPEIIGQSFSYLFQFLHSFPFAPTSSQMLSMLAVVFAWEFGMIVWRALNWVMRKIPGVN